MGVTKQAVQKRFVAKGTAEPRELDPKQGFSKFTPRAANVVVVSQNEARERSNNEISAAYLILGLAAEPESLASAAVIAQGVSLDDVRAAAVAAVAPAVEGIPALIPFDAQAKKALELTLREALRLGHNYVGTEHILLALLELEAGDGPLSSTGLAKPAVESWLIQTLASLTH